MSSIKGDYLTTKEKTIGWSVFTFLILLAFGLGIWSSKDDKVETSTPVPAATIASKEPLSSLANRNTLRITSNKVIGTGILIAPNIAISARHVCTELTELPPGSKGGTDATSKATNNTGVEYDVVRIENSTNPIVDLCLLELRIRAQVGSPADIFKPMGVPVKWDHLYGGNIGRNAYIGGYSGGFKYSYRFGTLYVGEVVQLDPFGLNSLLVEWASVHSSPGISGSGALDEDGMLVGVVSVVGPPGTGVVPSFAITAFLEANCISQKGKNGAPIPFQLCPR